MSEISFYGNLRKMLIMINIYRKIQIGLLGNFLLLSTLRKCFCNHNEKRIWKLDFDKCPRKLKR